TLAVRVDGVRRSMTMAPEDGDRPILLEGLASVALPLFAQHSGARVLRGAAAARDGHGVLLCAVGGSGKSSLLMALVASGWQAISEDQCAVGWDETGRHRAW